MTPEQRYLFDINGYLHLPNVLSDSELTAAQAAIDRYMATPDDELTDSFSRSDDGKFYANGFAFDRSSRRTWCGLRKQDQNHAKQAPAIGRKCLFFW